MPTTSMMAFLSARPSYFGRVKCLEANIALFAHLLWGRHKGGKIVSPWPTKTFLISAAVLPSVSPMAMMPPIEVPAIRSKHSPIGRPAFCSSRAKTSIVNKPR